MAKSRKLVVVDLYAGAGGATTGMLKALSEFGIEISYGVAVNHWPVAVDTHTVNHPNIIHICESLERVDPCKAVPGGRVDILWASPECTHHSNARGGRPMQDQSRAGANHVLAWLDKLYVANLIIENVPEWENWGPLNAHGRPIISKIGQCFEAFKASLVARNYKLEYRIVCCADYGDATTRERLIMIASRTNKIVWEPPTHRPPDKIEDLFTAFKPWKVARECIDWTDLGTPLHEKPLKTFETFTCNAPVTIETKVLGEDQKIDTVCGWTKTRQKSKKGKPFKCCPRCKALDKLTRTEEMSPLSPNTMRRIFAGLEKFSGLPFVLGTRTDSDRVYSTDRPLPTLTTESRSINLAVPAVKSAIVPTNYGEREGQKPRSHDPDAPMPALVGTQAHGIASFVLGQQSCAAPRSVDDPLPAVATDGAISLTTPIIVQTDQVGGKGTAKSVDEPLPSQVSKQKDGLVNSFIVRTNNLSSNETQPKSIDKPLPAVTTQPGLAITNFVVSCCHGEGDDTRRQHDADKPLPTLQGTNQFAAVKAEAKEGDGSFLASVRHGDSIRIHDPGKPLPALTCKGELAKITPFILRLRGTGDKQIAESPKSVEEPLGAISTSGAHHALTSYITTYYGNGGAESIDKPLSTQSTRDRFLLVNPMTNEMHEIIIYFRLLKLRELANAHSFPKSYKFRGTKTQGVKQVGNSNPVEMTCAMTRSVIRQYLKPRKTLTRVAA